jgi:cyclopropane fatty-acyl-phospholipid synthase-like methyltransferase
MVQRYYDTIAPAYLGLYEQEQRQKIEEILNILNIDSSKAVLDVGCGAGLLQRYIKNYVGVDISHELLKKFDGRRVVGTGFDLPFKEMLKTK